MYSFLLCVEEAWSCFSDLPVFGIRCFCGSPPHHVVLFFARSHHLRRFENIFVLDLDASSCLILFANDAASRIVVQPILLDVMRSYIPQYASEAIGWLGFLLPRSTICWMVADLQCWRSDRTKTSTNWSCYHLFHRQYGLQCLKCFLLFYIPLLIIWAWESFSLRKKLKCCCSFVEDSRFNIVLAIWFLAWVFAQLSIVWLKDFFDLKEWFIDFLCWLCGINSRFSVSKFDLSVYFHETRTSWRPSTCFFARLDFRWPYWIFCWPRKEGVKLWRILFFGLVSI